MIPTTQLHTLVENGATVVGDDGTKIGKAGELYLDDRTAEPSWVTVKTGLFGTAETFVPLGQATAADTETIRVPYAKDLVKDAPRVEVDQHLSEQEEQQLYEYYGLSYTDAGAGGGRTGQAGTGGRSRTEDRSADRDHDASVVRSEEEVHVGTQRREAGKARLRKYVVTDHVTKTVPVQREEVRIEREPVSGAAPTGGLGNDEAEVTLHEDEVVVDKETKPVERVSLDTDTVTEQRTVDETVRQEQVDVETDERRR